MTELSVLTVPNFSLPFFIEINASNKVLGVFLMQNGRSMDFLSQPLSDHAQQKSVYKK